MRKPAGIAIILGLTLAAWAAPQASGKALQQASLSEPVKPRAAPSTDAGTLPCFDVALVASAPRYHWLPVPDGEGIILRSPVRITFDVEEVMAGRLAGSTVTINTGLHTRYNSRIRYFLFYLKSDGSGGYRIVEMSDSLVRSRDGSFVIPVTAPFAPPPEADDLNPPPDYEKLLRPIRYDAADAWWLQSSDLETRADGSIATEAHPWGVVRKSGILAPRGLRVDDVVKSIANRRCSDSARKSGPSDPGTDPIRFTK
ncbi:hypothetical protein NDN01_24930 [Sphingomonas sp. QA11]|uniref:hypothetical protein n=1 Tax=Sphingomonas sp. QA11 TaxID=2950605 RepID=UPI00234B7630|nr:hypothetical protein [Sphingomonas sp. QA11]WCM27188.1 hypothetical protein NDN01_24930 [Sphingomonas sp. QA11]